MSAFESALKASKASIQQLQSCVKNYKKTGKERRTITNLKNRLENLQKCFDYCFDRHLVVCETATNIDQEDKYFSDEIFEQIEEIFIDTKSEIEEAISNLEMHSAPSVSNINSHQQNASRTPTNSTHLPPIPLPKFNGKYANWSSFHDLFVTLIHANKSLDSVQKLHYLKSNLEGEAAHLLRHYQVTAANYEPAWLFLKKRFQNKRILVNHQLRQLINQQNAQESELGIRRLLDCTLECTQALRNLEIDITTWDAILVFILTQKLPAETHQLWEQSLDSTNEIPQFDNLIKFLDSRFRTLEMIGSKPRSLSHHNSHSNAERRHQSSSNIKSHQANVKELRCLICKEDHATHLCQSFLSLSHEGRLDLIKQKELCLNCLHSGHRYNQCPSKKRCFVCQKKHNTLLHRTSEDTASVNLTNVQTEQTSSGFSASSSPLNPHANQFLAMVANHTTSSKQILLATAMVKIKSQSGKSFMLRALLDQGSQASFITEDAVQSLKLNKINISARISGIGNSGNCIAHSKVSMNLSDIKSKTIITVEAFVLRSLTQVCPGRRIHIDQWKHLEGLELADPKYFEPNKVDLLLGADIYAQIIQNGVAKGAPGSPIAQKTTLGWILSGEINSQNSQLTNHVISLHTQLELNQTLQRFWQLEEIESESHNSNEDIECEKFYAKTTQRKKDGRYIVQLPFKNGATKTFGRSRNIAVARLIQLERHFEKNPTLHQDYSACIQEYLDLGHMKPVETLECQNIIETSELVSQYKCNYLPHHAVFKESSTTRTRVVFNASSKNADGLSLNDKLHVGPVIQNNLVSIILNWRKYKIAFTADLHKMYRQIEVPNTDANFQRIVWRRSKQDQIKDFYLKTVTFGTSSAPFLAIRTIQQLAMDEGSNYPIAKDAVLNEFYVDDLLSGADDIEEGLEKQRQLVAIMKSGKFELRKWSTNNSNLLSNIPPEFIEMNTPLDLQVDDSIKTLGVHWHPKSDQFSYKIKVKLDIEPATKRKVVSEVAKLFDPIGWIAPIIIVAKILIQQLWLSGLGWDDQLNGALMDQWIQYREALLDVEHIQVPRWIQTSTQNSFNIELHGFSDASQHAYAAVVYLRVETATTTYVNIITAKTKVAPLKTVSLPRLELCGAVLLAKLLKSIIATLRLDLNSIFAWTDSQIVLAWLRGEPTRWNTFVANRVSLIQSTVQAKWQHVMSKDNPADCASRGMMPRELKQHELWWQGPSWLIQNEANWPISTLHESTLHEKKVSKVSCYQICMEPDELLCKYSTINKLIRITARCFRFIFNCRSSKQNRLQGWLTSSELQKALEYWIKVSQAQDFSNEIYTLKQNQTLQSRSKILSLTPFLDERNILRVGGRLQNSNLAFQQKHPMLLGEKSSLAKLIIMEAHARTLHGGPQLMMACIRQRFWIPNLRNLVRQCIHKCVTCYRYKAQTINQLMGNLPRERISVAKPFFHTGIDYCGPFHIKASLLPRNTTMVKCYIAIFVCMAIKAVHIEIVDSMTTDAFVAAFKRFVARRGYTGHIHLHTDNGTNFVGAEAQLRKEIQSFYQNENLFNFMSKDNITWHFIPPKAPSFGGLWEAAVKSTKYHLKRILQNARLNIVEFSTILTQIEACLNSRPLQPLNSDPNDIAVLTPGHFLTSDSLLAIPEPSYIETKDHRLNRWQLFQKLIQIFWKNWSQNYLNTLQQRPKWASAKNNVEKGCIVLIKEDNLPPSRWALGRVIALHPGTDGLVRVVTLKTKTTVIKRPINKICLLPIDMETD